MPDHWRHGDLWIWIQQHYSTKLIFWKLARFTLQHLTNKFINCRLRKIIRENTLFSELSISKNKTLDLYLRTFNTSELPKQDKSHHILPALLSRALKTVVLEVNNAMTREITGRITRASSASPSSAVTDDTMFLLCICLF